MASNGRPLEEEECELNSSGSVLSPVVACCKYDKPSGYIKGGE
jgi:hypothetical protein